MKNFIICFISAIFLISCIDNIEPENKICTVAKITKGKVFTKGGRKEYAYFYKGKLYLGTAAFDNRYFSYGDMFLIFFDKTNPNECGNLRNKIKINNSRDFEKVDSINYYLDEEDLNRLDSIE